jgi:hypothetical protein
MVPSVPSILSPSLSPSKVYLDRDREEAKEDADVDVGGTAVSDDGGGEEGSRDE